MCFFGFNKKKIMSRILIVDDNEDVLQVMNIIFTSQKFEVETTTKGEETYKLVNTFHPELIFLDINLGAIDGRDISRHLKRTTETKHISIILFSANVIKSTMLQESLADDFVAKPFDIKEMMIKVNKVIANAEGQKSMIG
jgi:two-component system phosphate regulon response regulator PhoB/two-component system alkaline phosphatase synthesis response regulator PhoP